MIKERPKLTESDISFKNWGKSDFVKNTLELAKNLQEDFDKKERLSQSECLVCFYKKGGLATNACVNTNCRSCNKEIWFGNSDTDELCINCAKKYKLCKACGSDLEYKERRKQRIFDFQSRVNK